MKNFPFLLSVLLLTMISNPALAKKGKQQTVAKKEQQQKAAIKAWKKRKNKMKPLQLKALVEENQQLKMDNQQLQEEVKFTQAELQKLIKLKAKIDALCKQRGLQRKNRAKDSVMANEGSDSWQAGNVLEEEDYADLETLFTPQSPAATESQADREGPDGLSKDDWAVDKNGKYYIKGLAFKVQIGASRQYDLSDVLAGEKTQQLFEQEQLKGLNLYTLGHFKGYWKANKFKKALRAMGLKDAWIVAFRDGKRVPLKTVLKEVLHQPK